MTPSLEWWARLTGGLAVEAALLMALAAGVTHWVRRAQWRRSIWLAAFVLITLVWTLELSGVRTWMMNKPLSPNPARQISIRVDRESPRVPDQSPLNVDLDPVGETSMAPVAGELESIGWWPGAVWILGVTAFVLKLFGTRVWVFWRLRRGQRPVSLPEGPFERSGDGSLSEPVDTVSAIAKFGGALGVDEVRVVQWAALRGPVAFGFLRPSIALPEDFEQRFTPVQCHAMLAHELGHLARRDPLWLFFVDLICAAAWWHPMVWLGRRKFRTACESAADDASALVPEGRLALAEALVTFGRQLTAPRGLGVAGSGLQSELAHRVEALLDSSVAPYFVDTGRRWLIHSSAIAILIALLLSPWQAVPGGLGPVFASLRTAMPLSEIFSKQPFRSEVTQAGKVAPLAEGEKQVSKEAQETGASSKEVRGNDSDRIPVVDFPGETLQQASERLIRAASHLTGDNRLREVVIVDQRLELAQVRIRESLHNSTLTDAVSALTQAALVPVQTSLQDGVLLIARRTDLSEESQAKMKRAMQEFRDAGSALKGAQEAGRLDESQLNLQAAQYEKARRALDEVSRQVHVATRRFRLSTNDFQRELKPFMPPGASSAQALQSAVKAFCATNGIDFISTADLSASDPAALFYNDRTGVLFVRATMANLDRLEWAFQNKGLQWQPPYSSTRTVEAVRNAKRDAAAKLSDLSRLGKEDSSEGVILRAQLDGLGMRQQIMEEGGDGTVEGLRVTLSALQRDLHNAESSLAEFRSRDADPSPTLAALVQKRDSIRTYLNQMPPIPSGVVVPAQSGVATLVGSRQSETEVPSKLPAVTLAVTLVEIADGGINDVGLDWVFGQMATNNPPILSTFATNLPGMTKPLRGDQVRVDRLAVDGQATVLGSEQYMALLERLKGRHQVDVLSAPNVTTLSGRSAQVSVAEFQTIVVGVEDSEGSPATPASRKYLTVDLPLGPVLDLLPTAEGEGWRVKVIASVTEFLGYDDPKETGVAGGPSDKAAASKPGTPLPRLRVREAQAIATAQVGDVIALRGPLAETVVRNKDKVPVLGDIPLLGRLFRSESQQTQRKRLYVFVRPESSGAKGTETKSN